MNNHLKKFEFDKSSKFQSSSLNSTATSRDEMNLAEFPLAILSTRTNPSIKTLEFTDSHRLKTGESIERKWIITGADKFGLPTATDDDVILGLMRLSMDEGFRERKVYFTRYELLKTLRWSTEGKSYSRLTKSLDRLSGVRIRATNSFFDNSLKAYQTTNFGIIDAYEINDSRSNKTTAESEKDNKSYFIWSEMLFNSFKSGFIKKLDLDLYFSLKSAISRRLYRYLDKHFYYKSSVEKNLMNFAFEKLGLSRNYKYISSIKQQIEPALDELVEVGFLSSYQFEGKGELTKIIFNSKAIQSAKIIQSSNVEISNNINSLGKNSIIEALLSRGIAIAQSRRLVTNLQEHELEHVDSIIRYYDHLVENHDIKVSKNKVGFLYKAVENPFKFQVPEQFIEKKNHPNPRSYVNARNPRNRPELRVFKKDQTENKIHNPIQRPQTEKISLDYQEYVEREITKKYQSMDPAECTKIRSMIENRLKGLKSAIEDKYEYVLESCVRDEIKKRCDILSQSDWLSRKLNFR